MRQSPDHWPHPRRDQSEVGGIWMVVAAAAIATVLAVIGRALLGGG